MRLVVTCLPQSPLQQHQKQNLLRCCFTGGWAQTSAWSLIAQPQPAARFKVHRAAWALGPWPLVRADDAFTAPCVSLRIASGTGGPRACATGPAAAHPTAPTPLPPRAVRAWRLEATGWQALPPALWAVSALHGVFRTGKGGVAPRSALASGLPPHGPGFMSSRALVLHRAPRGHRRHPLDGQAPPCTGSARGSSPWV